MSPDNTTEEHITVEPETLREGRRAYMLHCRAAGLSQNTIVNYDHKTEVFVTWMEKRQVKLIAELTRENIREFFTELQAEHNQGGVHAYYRPVKAMIRWWWDEYERPGNNPIERVKVEAPKAKPRQGIPLEDFRRMVDACHGHYKLRDQAILYGLLDTCARVTEFCKLRIKDVNFTTGRCWIEYGKGGKGRAVRFGDRSLRALRKYLRQRGELKPNDPLFENDDGGPFDRFGLRSMIARRAKDAGVPMPGLHDFRRRGLYLLWKNTRDLKSVSEYAGHSNTEITLRYVATDEDDVQEAHRNGSPVDNADW